MPEPNKQLPSWVQDEGAQIALGLVSVGGICYRDTNGKFWFNDETQVDICGPFETLEQAKEAAIKYGRSI